MKVVVLAIGIVLLAAGVLGQNRALWQFYSGADCDEANIIGVNMEPVAYPESRPSVPCTNVDAAGQSFKMDVGAFTSINVKPDWISVQSNSDPFRCGSNNTVWDVTAAMRGVCIQYTYSSGNPNSFVLSGCYSTNPWNGDPAVGQIDVYFNSNGHDCAAGNGSYPFALEPVQGQLACLQTAAESPPSAIAGYCPVEFIDEYPPVSAAPVAAPVDAPVTAPMTVPSTAPSSTNIPVAPTSGPTKTSSSSSVMIQAVFVALGLVLSLLV